MTFDVEVSTMHGGTTQHTLVHYCQFQVGCRCSLKNKDCHWHNLEYETAVPQELPEWCPLRAGVVVRFKTKVKA